MDIKHDNKDILSLKAIILNTESIGTFQDLL